MPSAVSLASIFSERFGVYRSDYYTNWQITAKATGNLVKNFFKNEVIRFYKTDLIGGGALGFAVAYLFFPVALACKAAAVAAVANCVIRFFFFNRPVSQKRFEDFNSFYRAALPARVSDTAIPEINNLDQLKQLFKDNDLPFDPTKLIYFLIQSFKQQRHDEILDVNQVKITRTQPGLQRGSHFYHFGNEAPAHDIERPYFDIDFDYKDQKFQVKVYANGTPGLLSQKFGQNYLPAFAIHSSCLPSGLTN
jgi:hypothetical protein